MTFLRRLRVLPVALGVAATLAAAVTSLFGDVLRPGAAPPKPSESVRPDGGRLVEDLALTKFSKLPVLTYQSRAGEMLFAWQVKPTVDAAPARPRDVLVVVDASASQAGRPLQQARQILTSLAANLGAADRVSVWVASTPAATRPLTKGFLAPTSEDVNDAAISLTETEYGAGATDLKHALNKALPTIAPARGRQQLVLLLGDGESAFNPVTEDDRVALGNRMDATDVAFFAVPLGLKVNPQNLHGMAALTGGAVVRLQEDLSNPTARTEFTTRLLAAIDTPVVKADKFKFGDEVGEVFPTRLPPLRADRTTLVMGKLARAADAVTLSVNGTVAGRPVALNLGANLPPPQIDNFFLNMMVSQWRDAPHKDAPAMLQSDRALALASTQVTLYKEEFLAQAMWAITKSQWDDATKLYQAAQKIDPTDLEVAAALELVEKLRTGKVTRAQLEEKISAKMNGLKVTATGTVPVVIQNVVARQDPATGGGGALPATGAGDPPAAQDVLREAAARRAIEEQRYQVLVDATIRRARQLLRVDPDTAYSDLKRQRDEIAAYDAIGNTARAQLTADLEAVMREVFLKGAEVKRQASIEREAVSRSRQRLNEFDRALDDETRVKDRISQFRQLMKQARFELAYQEAQLMIQERIVKGQTVPPTAVASYIIGQQATQLREWKELVRIREDRFLLSMMQSEKSHIPYPDEPPVHFPPAAVWRELTSLRRDAYLNSNLGPNPSEAQKQLKSKIENTEVFLEDADINSLPLIELFQKLEKRYDIPFVFNEEQFKAEEVNDIKTKMPQLAATQLRGLKLGTFLDIVLGSVPGAKATFIVRPEYVEITTRKWRLENKVTRVFPVADLVIPIPSSVNPQTLQQNLFFQNSQLNIIGQVLGQANQLGINNNQGGGNFGGGNPLGQNGAQGQGQFGNLANQIGNNQGNVGFGAGALGVGGGNLGQFGNLGGQFGLQGGTQEGLLLALITETVDRGWWAQAQNVPVDPNAPMPMIFGSGPELHSLGYYSPAQALVIRGTSRYHSVQSFRLKDAADVVAAGPRNPRNPGAVAGNNPNGAGNNPNTGVANNAPVVGPTAPTINNPRPDVVAMRREVGNDPTRMWNAAISRTVTDPGLIVACAEFLMETNESKHAVEVLKGSLRKGLTTEAWTFDSLTLALQASAARQEDVERAAVSGIDLDPADAKAYLKAAKVEADMKNSAQAIAFCKRAAEFAPDQPAAYANALAYADLNNGKDVRTDAVLWATRGLMKRDWNTTDGIDYHKEVKARLPKLIGAVEKDGGKSDDLKKALSEQTQRDLVIELLWQGAADLDMSVAEPGGSTCSATQKRTTGGGVLKCDVLDQGNDRSETYTAAVAFKGTYKVSVKQAFGKPVGGTATLKVTKFRGTPKEAHDLITVDLASPKPVEVRLESGSRTELAVVSTDVDEYKAATTGAALTNGPSGLGGGFGAVGDRTGPGSGVNVPVVPTTAVKTVPGIGANAADIQASLRVNPDRQSMTFQFNPVFGTGRSVQMPTVPLIPGGEPR